jgi:hypothetical protein
LAGHFFSFVKSLSGEVCGVPHKLRNIDYRAGFYFAAAITSHAQL